MREPIDAVKVICDGCSADLCKENTDFDFVGRDIAAVYISEYGWRVIQGQDYCGLCWITGEDDRPVAIPRVRGVS